MQSPDPGVPLLPLRKEVVLLCGFLLCVAIAVVTLVLPELSGGEAGHESSGKPDAAQR
jgi:hypothetical protein